MNNVKFYINEHQSLELQEMEYSDNKKAVERAFEYIAKGMRAENATKRLPETRLIKFALAAWTYDKQAWQNLFSVRSPDSGTQNITLEIVNNMKLLINL